MQKVFFVSSSAVYNAVNGDEWSFFPLCDENICVECTCTRVCMKVIFSLPNQTHDDDDVDANVDNKALRGYKGC